MSDEKMDKIFEGIELGLKADQLLIRDRYFNLGNHGEKAKVVDEQITDLLKKFAKKGDSA